MKTNKHISDLDFRRMVQENAYLSWQISGMNIADLKRLLESLRVSKRDIDNFADFLDKEDNGFIEYSNFVKAICDFETYHPKKPVVEQVEQQVSIQNQDAQDGDPDGADEEIREQYDDDFD